MEKQLLKNPDIYPTDEVLKDTLGTVYPVYRKLIDDITGNTLNLIPEWRYYKDGNAWLCKVVNKKRTVLWISVWEGYIIAGIYFSQKNYEGVFELPISEQIKRKFAEVNHIGRMILLIMNIDKMEQLPDLLTVIEYRNKQK